MISDIGHYVTSSHCNKPCREVRTASCTSRRCALHKHKAALHAALAVQRINPFPPKYQIKRSYNNFTRSHPLESSKKFRMHPSDGFPDLWIHIAMLRIQSQLQSARICGTIIPCYLSPRRMRATKSTPMPPANVPHRHLTFSLPNVLTPTPCTPLQKSGPYAITGLTTNLGDGHPLESSKKFACTPRMASRTCGFTSQCSAFNRIFNLRISAESADKFSPSPHAPW